MRPLTPVVLLIGAAALGGCSGGVLDPKGPIAAAERLILLNSTGIMLAIVIPTILATLGTAYWFRASNTRARYMPDFAYSGRLELLVWSIPIMTVILVGGVTWIGSYDLDPPKPIASTEKPVRVQVVALDWKWLFIYPDQEIAAVNQLTIPVGAPIRFELTSSGVMNSFFVPQLGGQIYTMAGMVTRLHLQADHAGTYRGMSANYSGAGFSDMYFNVDAVPAERFAQWVAATRTTGPVLDAQTWKRLKSEPYPGTLGAVRFAPNGRVLVAVGDKGVLVYEVSSWQKKFEVADDAGRTKKLSLLDAAAGQSGSGAATPDARPAAPAGDRAGRRPGPRLVGARRRRDAGTARRPRRLSSLGGRMGRGGRGAPARLQGRGDPRHPGVARLGSSRGLSSREPVASLRCVAPRASWFSSALFSPASENPTPMITKVATIQATTIRPRRR